LEKIDLVQLDTVFQKGLLVIDEVNMAMADALRSMSNESLMFSNILQQLRKRQLNVIWTAQSEMHVTNRLRFQSDIFIVCQDLSLMDGHRNCGRGELSYWKCHDYSGIVVGEGPLEGKDKWRPFWEGTVFNKPWWNSFDTHQMQGLDDEMHGTPSKTPVKDEKLKQAQEIVADIRGKGFDSMPADVFWNHIGVEDFAERVRIGMQLQSVGVKKRKMTDGRYEYLFQAS
jgi:hypothetical protein